MNNNYNNFYCDYIGALGSYSITDYVDNTSNILHNEIIYTSNILNLKIDYTSNILHNEIIYTSNVLIDYTNELKNELWSVNPNNNNSYLKINLDQFGNSNLYLNNPNGFGKINFLTNHPLFPNANNILTRIDYDNKLYVYFAGSIFPPKLPAWWCVEEQLSAIFDVNTAQDTAIIGLQGELINLQGNLGYLSGQIQQLQIYTLLDTANTRIALAINSFTLAQNVLLGASGISLAVASAALATSSYINNNYISLNLYNEITSNNTISSVERSNLLNIVTSNIYSNSLKISTNSSNLNLINGFINCNIQSQQFINDLHVNNLDVNNASIDNLDVNNATIDNLSGNIANINNIQTNNINANFGIFSNITIISTIYATSNDVVNIAQQQPTYFKKLNITIPNSRFNYDGINSLFYYDLNIQQYIPYSTYGSFKYRNFRISTFVENTDWIGGRNLKDTSGNYYNNPEPLTFYCNNAQNISGILNPNDSYHNCIILGKSVNTNIGNWSAVANNFNYIRYLTKIGWDMQIILEMLN